MSIFSRYTALVALTVLGASGCYRYVPTTLDAVPQGEAVRLFVSRNVLIDLQDAIPTSTPELRGRINRTEGDQIFLRVPVGGRQVGFHTAPIDQEIPIPVREVTSVQLRQMDRVATGGLIGATIGVAALVIFVIMEAVGEPDPVEECPDCADMRLPRLSIPIR